MQFLLRPNSPSAHLVFFLGADSFHACVFFLLPPRSFFFLSPRPLPPNILFFFFSVVGSSKPVFFLNPFLAPTNVFFFSAVAMRAPDGSPFFKYPFFPVWAPPLCNEIFLFWEDSEDPPPPTSFLSVLFFLFFFPLLVPFFSLEDSGRGLFPLLLA